MSNDIRITPGTSTQLFENDDGTFTLQLISDSGNALMQLTGNIVLQGSLTIENNLNVLGSQVIFEVETVESESNRILLNKNGNDATFGGIEIERSGDNALIQFNSGLTSKWEVGVDGDLSEVVTVDGNQTLTNKSINASQLTGSLVDDWNQVVTDFDNHESDDSIHFTQAEITEVGELDSGSISSGFGPINVGNSSISGGQANFSQDSTFGGTITLGTQASSSGHAVRADRTISAGNGLTGGGDLTSNVTLTLGNPSTITVSTSNGTTSDSHTHSLDLSGRTLTFDPDSDSVITWANNAQNLGNNRTWTPSIASHGSNQRGTLNPGSQTIYGNKTFNSDVVFSSNLSSPNAVSGSTGWQGNSDGHWDFRSITADSLIIDSFTANVAQAFRGSRSLSKSFATLDESFTIPAVDSSATLTVREIDGHPGLEVFEQDDYILLNIVEQSEGLLVGEAWGEITSPITDNQDGTQSFTLTIRHLSDVSLEGKTANQGSEAISFGSASSPKGFLYETVLDPLGSPYSQAAIWDTNPWDRNNWETKTRTGNLDGITNAQGFGFYGENLFLTKYLLAGDLSKSNSYLEYDGTNILLVGAIRQRTPGVDIIDPNFRGEWTDDILYFEGDVIKGTDGNQYYATQEHTSSSSTRPTSGGSWESYWNLFLEKGEDGEDGSSISIQGTVSDSSQLPATGDDGDAWITEDTGHLWVWDGSSWQDVGQIQGPAGEDGQDGDPAPEVIFEYSSDGSSDWSTTYDPNADHKWVRFSTDGGNTWSDPAKFIGEDGEDGEPAPFLLVRYGETENGPWFNEFQEGRDWIQTSNDDGQTWSSSVKIVGEDGEKGDPGDPGEDGSFVEYRFQVNQSPTNPPSLNDSDRTPSGWSDAPPSVGEGDYLWMIKATIDADDNLESNWAGPTRISGDKGDKGDQGDQGPEGPEGPQGDPGPGLVFRGEYDSSATYFADDVRVDVVRSGSDYYYALQDDFSGESPPDAAYWGLMSQFDSIATGLLLTQDAAITRTLTIGEGEPEGVIRSAGTTFSSGTGFWLGYDDGDPKFRTGSTSRYFQFDGTDISWQGENTSLTTGGLFTAQDADITGKISANEGDIGNWTITANDIHSGSIFIISSGEGRIEVGDDYWDGNGQFLFGGSTDAIYYPGSGKVEIGTGVEIQGTAVVGKIESDGWDGTDGDGFAQNGTQIDLDNGNIISEAFYVVDGNARFKGDISGSSGNFEGNISFGNFVIGVDVQPVFTNGFKGVTFDNSVTSSPANIPNAWLEYEGQTWFNVGNTGTAQDPKGIRYNSDGDFIIGDNVEFKGDLTGGDMTLDGTLQIRDESDDLLLEMGNTNVTGALIRNSNNSFRVHSNFTHLSGFTMGETRMRSRWSTVSGVTGDIARRTFDILQPQSDISPLITVFREQIDSNQEYFNPQNTFELQSDGKMTFWEKDGNDNTVESIIIDPKEGGAELQLLNGGRIVNNIDSNLLINMSNGFKTFSRFDFLTWDVVDSAMNITSSTTGNYIDFKRVHYDTQVTGSPPDLGSNENTEDLETEFRIHHYVDPGGSSLLSRVDFLYGQSESERSFYIDYQGKVTFEENVTLVNNVDIQGDITSGSGNGKGRVGRVFRFTDSVSDEPIDRDFAPHADPGDVAIRQAGSPSSWAIWMFIGGSSTSTANWRRLDD